MWSDKSKKANESENESISESINERKLTEIDVIEESGGVVAKNRDETIHCLHSLHIYNRTDRGALSASRGAEGDEIRAYFADAGVDRAGR